MGGVVRLLMQLVCRNPHLSRVSVGTPTYPAGLLCLCVRDVCCSLELLRHEAWYCVFVLTHCRPVCFGLCVCTLYVPGLWMECLGSSPGHNCGCVRVCFFAYVCAYCKLMSLYSEWQAWVSSPGRNCACMRLGTSEQLRLGCRLHSAVCMWSLAHYSSVQLIRSIQCAGFVHVRWRITRVCHGKWVRQWVCFYCRFC